MDALLDEEIISPILELDCEGRETINISTLGTYLAALDEGYHARSNIMGKMQSDYENALKIISAFQNAKPPSQSFISSPRVGVCDLHYLPKSSLFFGENGGNDDELPNLSEVFSPDGFGGDKVVYIKSVSSKSLTYWLPETYEGRWYREVARFDFTNSGLEQILAIEDYFCTGTMTFSEVVTLTKHNDDDPFVINSVSHSFRT